MATDRDDEIARRYRALATEEPGATLDDAILAKSRRAVGTRPGGLRRWGPPLSIAAVLVLASGVVIRMQAEKPGIETAAPVREAAPAPANAPAPIPQPSEPSAREAAPRIEQAAPVSPPARAREAKRAQEPKRAQRETSIAPAAPQADTERRFVPEPPPASPPAPAALDATAPAPAALGARANAPAAAPRLPTQSSVAPATAPAPLERGPQRMNAAPAAAASASASDASSAPSAPAAKQVQRFKSEAQDRRAEPLSPEARLDRIAALRSAGRDDEADRALEAFRRDYPGYRLSDAQWEKVRRRAP